MPNDPQPESSPDRPRRRVRYRGKNPRRFEEKYKEHQPERYADTIAKVLASGKDACRFASADHGGGSSRRSRSKARRDRGRLHAWLWRPRAGNSSASATGRSPARSRCGSDRAAKNGSAIAHTRLRRRDIHRASQQLRRIAAGAGANWNPRRRSDPRRSRRFIDAARRSRARLSRSNKTALSTCA